MRLHHVQVACPPGGEDVARRCYAAGLGMAFVVDSLDEVAARLGELGFEVDRSQRDSFPGHVRFHTCDGHGNRVEVLA